ncbi:MAG: FadR family transcriptional regulator [Candidatus Aminicenantes bacterium]|nr:FadR family transcriptional regulator [Candidatus Aminicenantes bacterium]MDH5386228.1 FadR family transcriptional regulator [Candidatus Aminicenantes bacterium]MDH5745014.1 FadR family transcriptional regulator [Candidatus Aminicenantes bacterium]
MIKKKKLADEVIDAIKRMIQSGELKEGDKLPNQTEFAAHLGVSRTSLREAFNTLCVLGVLEQHQGYGTIVKSRFSALYADHLSAPFITDEKATMELLEARQFMEIGAARLAAKNATKRQIKEMGTLIDEMAKAGEKGDTQKLSEQDIDFHFLVAQATGNRVMIHLLANIRGLMEKFMHEAFLVLHDQKRYLKAHRGIFEAIKQKNPKKASSLMKKHIMDVQKDLQQYYRVVNKGR